ncbi:GGDEF domain-containing protein [Actinoplanes sp. Pm04-4]|uniref:GGDEF domain-containing protein n=1 Tax=Paractinoplanes pyxinae TaxID=2997416 RepID=A0ABT4BCD6_9ACTN|nr:GGDEF domain-containing protein [Actinoplanes pyxinae]MCY1143652.1 GGDEF domain-containing protein [Actinoplanes pyxinae]
MTDVTRHAAHLLERAQGGHAAEVLVEVEELLGEPGGDVACLHFVRSIALNMLGDLCAAREGLDRMAAVAEREQSPGWLGCAIATRASERIKVGEVDGADYDLEEVLRDLVAAENLVMRETEPVAAINGRVAVAASYFDLRLFELVGEHYQAAYEITVLDGQENGNRAMWLSNIAELHLHWALELYSVGQVAAAEGHTAQAEIIASRAAAEADGSAADVWHEYALLLAACAKADRHDPATAAEEIGHHLGVLESQGMSTALLAYSRPFHAVALRRTGRPDEAMVVLEKAIATLPADAGLTITLATRRTHALLLADSGSAGARAGLAYGDTLAAALWQQRQRTLHTVTMMKSLETLRQSHEQASKAADLDSLTAIANRRAYDRALVQASARPDDLVAVLVIDTDKFKKINDTAGHAAGDAALRAIARALSTQIRDDDLIARLGGDEFVALLPGAGTAVAKEVASRMVRAVRDIPDCPATVSIGLVSGRAGTLIDMVERADRAMYRVKRRGGDGIEEGPDEVAVAA